MSHCPVCHNLIDSRTTTIQFRFADGKKSPVICEGCQQEYVAQDIAKHLSQLFAEEDLDAE